VALLTKSDLAGKYSWTAISGDDPRVSGPPDSTLLSRGEGYEVLYFINKMAEIHGFKQKISGLKVERMLKDVPSDQRSQKNIQAWIEKNWSSYP
jgi:hypothetical protein